MCGSIITPGDQASQSCNHVNAEKTWEGGTLQQELTLEILLLYSKWGFHDVSNCDDNNSPCSSTPGQAMY